LVEAADHIARAVRKKRQLFSNDLKQFLVIDVFDTLDGTVDPLEIGANLGFAVFERTIQDRTPEVARCLAVPHLLDGAFLHVAERLCYPILAAGEDVASVPAPAQDLEPSEGLRTEQAPAAVCWANRLGAEYRCVHRFLKQFAEPVLSFHMTSFLSG